MAKKKNIDSEIIVTQGNKLDINDGLSFEVQNLHLMQQDIEILIYIVRNCQVMLDSDLAMLYGVETKYLKRAVKANIIRFPADFMFELTKDEFANLRCKNGTSNMRGGTRYMPYAFTENGVAMLSEILRSQTAIDVNIQIMRAFTAMRNFIASNVQVFQRLEVIEHHQLEISAHQSQTDHQIEEIFKRLDQESITPTQGIFFDGEVFDAYRFACDLVRSAKKTHCVA